VSAEPGTRIADKFVIERRIGKGGMGEVYAAREVASGDRIALKLSTVRGAADVFRERFNREAKIGNILGRVKGIVRARDWGELEDGWSLYLAMDLVEDAKILDLKLGSLRERVLRMVEVCELVAEVHAHGVVHRDVKPANFMQTPDGEIHLADFGLAKTLRGEMVPELRELENSSLTKTGVTLGTPAYMAPEQFDDAKYADERADVFSLGVMAYRAVTGRFPYHDGGSELGKIYFAFEKTRRGERPPPRAGIYQPELSEAADGLILRALSIEPADRPSAQELADGLALFAAERSSAKVARVRRVGATSARRPSSSRGRAADEDEQTKLAPPRVDPAAVTAPAVKPAARVGAAAPRSRIDAHLKVSTANLPRRWPGRALLLLGSLLAVGGLGALLLDVAGVQASLPVSWQGTLGGVTARIYAHLNDAQVARLDVRPPSLKLKSAEESGPDWTSSDSAILRIQVRDASLARLTVSGADVEFPPRQFQVTLNQEVPLERAMAYQVVLTATDRAGRTAQVTHTISRVDPERFLTATLERGGEGERLRVRGRLDPAGLATRARVAGAFVRVADDGTFSVELEEREDDLVEVLVRSPRGDVVRKLLSP